MSPSSRLLFTLAFVWSFAAAANAQYHEWKGEPLAAVQIQTVAYKAWLPERATPLRGTLILIPGRHGDGRGMAADAKYLRKSYVAS